MAKIAQSCRIGHIFGVPQVSSCVAFSRLGQPLTVAELALAPFGNGLGRPSASDDAYLVITNVGAPCRMRISSDAYPGFDGVVSDGRTIIVDLAKPFHLSWSGTLTLVVAYLPRRAIFEGKKGGEDYSLTDNILLEDELLGAIMACLRHTAGTPVQGEFDMFARQLLFAACSRLACAHAVRTCEPRLAKFALADEQLKKVTEYILDNLDLPVSMRKAAAVCGLPYRLFCRAFKASVGASPHDWAMATRVERAKRLMQATPLRLSEIALAVGFCDQSHFNRVFTRFSACTPGEWRRGQDAGRSNRVPESA